MNQNRAWLTEKEDMNLVSSILEKHFIFTNKSQIFLLYKNASSLTSDNSFDQKEDLPDWLEEIKVTFLDHYGYEHGLAILFNIMTKFLLINKKIH